MERSIRHAIAGQAVAADLQCERWTGERPKTRAAERTGNAAPSGGSPDDERSQWLAQTIEAEIIPRLLLAHRAAALQPLPAPGAPRHPTAEDAVELADLVLGEDPFAGLEHVRGLGHAGLPRDVLFLELLAPTARRLGALWEADLCSFADVTVGLWRLHQMVHEFSPDFHADDLQPLQLRRAILAPVPGSQHTLGLLMVAEFFRRAGWQVWGDATVSARQILAAARGEHYHLVGLSLGSETHVDSLKALIDELRAVSRNPALTVIIGGPIVLADPTLVAQVGADATAMDAPQAVIQAERLVTARLARAR